MPPPRRRYIRQRSPAPDRRWKAPQFEFGPGQCVPSKPDKGGQGLQSLTRGQRPPLCARRLNNAKCAAHIDEGDSLIVGKPVQYRVVSADRRMTVAMSQPSISSTVRSLPRWPRRQRTCRCLDQAVPRSGAATSTFQVLPCIVCRRAKNAANVGMPSDLRRLP